MVKMTLKAARINADLDQKSAAEKLGVSNKTLCNWEKGRTMPNIKNIDAICQLYGVTYDNLTFLPSNSL